MKLATCAIRTLIWLVAAASLFASSLQAATDWPQFRGPTGQGVSEAKNIPVHWSATSNLVWQTAIPGEGWSSPVLANDRVYLTTATTDAGQTSLRVLCLDGKAGSVIWNVTVLQPEADQTKFIHQKNSLASPTPIVHNGRIYVHFGHLGSAALDLNGKIVWTQTALKYPPLHGNGGSPVLVDDMLVFSCDGASEPFVAALDANTGKLRWRTARNTPAKRQFSFSTPLVIQVDGQTQVISPGSGFAGAYDPKEGREIWRVRYGEGYSLIPRPVFAHGLLFLSSGFDRPVMYAIKPAGAKGDATESNVAWTYPKGAPSTPSPLVAGAELYIVSDAGIATCFDARTGTVHWNERLGGDFSASPVFADGRIYFQNEAGVGYVVKAGTSFELLAKNDLGERTLASPAVTAGALILRSKSHLWRLGK